jgi:hypothetical protein
MIEFFHIMTELHPARGALTPLLSPQSGKIYVSDLHFPFQRLAFLA